MAAQSATLTFRKPLEDSDMSKERQQYKGPEGHERDRRLPDGSINWDYVGSKNMTLREWHTEVVVPYLDGSKPGVCTPEFAEMQFESAVEVGLIT